MKLILTTLLWLSTNLAFSMQVSDLHGKAEEDALNREFKGGVLEGKASLLIDAEKKHGVPAILMAAIAVQESGGGKSRMARKQNNVFGITPNGKKGLTFASVEDCIEYEAKLLKNKYIGKGKNTVSKIGRTYCKGDNRWHSKVNQHIRRMAKK